MAADVGGGNGAMGWDGGAASAHDVQISVKRLFPTPVAEVLLPDTDALNAELKRLILAREAAGSGVQHSNLGGWQSAPDFEDWAGPPGATLADIVRQIASNLTVDRAGKPVSVKWQSNGWANINRAGHANEFHTHPGAFWSAVYYVDDGGAADDPALGGELEIQDPRGVAPAMYAPALAFNFPGGQSVGAAEVIRPRASSMILFPSWLSHAVRPFHGSGARISVAINLSL